MDSQDRINLKKLVSEMDCEDNTASIRKLKHSVLIRNDIRKLESLKQTQSSLLVSDLDAFRELAKVECVFLYNNYMEIFNKIVKNELDLNIMSKLLVVLKLIEDGQVDQHEGSAMVGKILKELYIDSALRTSENLDNANGTDTSVAEKIAGQNISWKQYKELRGQMRP